MDLLVDPKSLYDRSSGGEEWNEAMAFLGHDEMKKSYKKKLTHITKPGKSLLKCGFICTGRPKQIWAMRIEGSTIELGYMDKPWFQIGSDMLITNYDDLGKYRNSVQQALEFGVRHFIDYGEVQNGDNTCVEKVMELPLESDVVEHNSVDADDGEYCCAGTMCGIDKSQSKLIKKINIRHQCWDCKKAMHGGICGAEASTILTNQACAV